MKTNFIDILNVPDISESRNYWILRTNGGMFYSDFILHQYVAIAWDTVTLNALNTQSIENIKRLIETSEKISPSKEELDDKTKETKGIVTTIYNKLHRFVFEIKIGDIVLIPNKSSESITIGEVISDAYEEIGYTENYLIKNPDTEITPCPYIKRRKIKTLKTITKREMDIYLVKGFNSQHAISSLNDYSDYINRTLYAIYTKGEELHSTIHAGHPNGLTLKELLKLIQYIDNTVDDIASQCELRVGERDIEVKLNFHSPGLIELIGYGAAAGTTIAIVMFALNNLINGGKFKVSFKKEITGEMDFSIESETKGIKGNERKDKEIQIRKSEVLLNMVKELDIKSPEIISSLLNDEKITTEMVSAAIDSDKENLTPRIDVGSVDKLE